MGYKVVIIAVIILFNVKVNSHLFNHLQNLGHRPITTLVRPHKNILCSTKPPINIKDLLIKKTLLHHKSRGYENSHEPHFLKNGIQQVPTRRFMSEPTLSYGNAILEHKHKLVPSDQNSIDIIPKLIASDSSCKSTDDVAETVHNLDENANVIDIFESRRMVNVTIHETCLTKYINVLERFERMFYMTTFNKFTSIAPENRQENGMSFVQSGLFLQLILIALSSEVDTVTRNEIEDIFKLNSCDMEQTNVMNQIISSLPESDDDIKFRWTSRLILNRDKKLHEEFTTGPANALKLHIDHFNGTESPSEIAVILNQMVEKDSGGAIRDTFDEDDFVDNVEAVLITTVYLRAQWRSAPTLINGTHEFIDSENGPYKTVRMIRINDIVKYTKLDDWKAEAIEIFYKTPGLSLLVLVAEGHSIQNLARHVSDTNISAVIEKMRSIRVAVTLPLYTLRMTLLLPNKLQAMGLNHLVNVNDRTESDSLRISHAVQRLMFWAEAGRNAFKDDGIEWDEHPELEVLVNRPYIFYVRWKNMTLMNGNFVL